MRLDFTRSDFNLVLITIRPHKIVPWLKHHESLKPVILDGSEKGLRIDYSDYHHLPSHGYFERVSYAVQNYNSKYFIIGGDDEYLDIRKIRTILQDARDKNCSLVTWDTLLAINRLSGSWQKQYDPIPNHIALQFLNDKVESRITQKLVLWSRNRNRSFWYSCYRRDVLYELLKVGTDSSMTSFEAAILPVSLCLGKVLYRKSDIIKRIKKDRAAKIKLTDTVLCPEVLHNYPDARLLWWSYICMGDNTLKRAVNIQKRIAEVFKNKWNKFNLPSLGEK